MPIDQMQKTAKAIVLFEMKTFEPEMRLMADAIVECASLVLRAMPLLANIGQHVGQLNEICLQVSRIEGRADEKLRELIGAHGFTIANLSTRLVGEGKLFEYRMVIRSRDRANAQHLTEHLLGLPDVIEFRISPTGD